MIFSLLFATLVYNTLISNNFVPEFEILYYFIDFNLFVFNDLKNILFNFKKLARYSYFIDNNVLEGRFLVC